MNHTGSKFRFPGLLCAVMLLSGGFFVPAPLLAQGSNTSGIIPPGGSAKQQEMLELPAMPQNVAPAPVAKPQPVLVVPPVNGAANPASTTATPPVSVSNLPALPGAAPVVVPPSLPAAADVNAVKVTPKPEATLVPALLLPKATAAGTAAVPAVAEVKTPLDYNPNMTLMFSSDEMQVFARILKAYDSYEPAKQSAQPKDGDIGEILTGLGNTAPQPVEARPLQNLYLGGIVYYSPSNWVVRINGRVITSKTNAPGNEFYVSQISRKEVELLWKPSMMGELQDRWNQMTDNGKNPIPNIGVSNGVIRLNLHPNQTFLPRSVVVREGLFRPEAAPSASMPAMDNLPKSDNGVLSQPLVAPPNLPQSPHKGG